MPWLADGTVQQGLDLSGRCACAASSRAGTIADGQTSVHLLVSMITKRSQTRLQNVQGQLLHRRVEQQCVRQRTRRFGVVIHEVAHLTHVALGATNDVHGQIVVFSRDRRQIDTLSFRVFDGDFCGVSL